MIEVIDKRNEWNQSHKSDGRDDHKVEMIVIHGMALTDGSLVPKGWNEREASAHYGVKNKNVEMYVLPENTAWQAGNWNINIRTIGVEHLNSTGAPTWEFSEDTLATSVEFIAQLLKEYGLTVNDVHMHQEFVVTECPQSLATSANWKSYLSRIAKLTGDELNIRKIIVPDGNFSIDLINGIEEALGKTVTGLISSQPISNLPLFNGNNIGFEFVSDDSAKGSDVVRELQKRLNIKVDGFWGVETFKALGRRYEAESDGSIKLNDPLITKLAAQLNTHLEDFIRQL